LKAINELFGHVELCGPPGKNAKHPPSCANSSNDGAYQFEGVGQASRRDDRERLNSGLTQSGK
jgi:hypothetical protein